ncbi:MAG: insulinase family protein, partial [bacterium]|nr:insulinase family protein [bacterium]
MKKYLLLVVFVFSIMSCESYRGIKVIKLPIKTDPTISFRIWFKVGSQNDPAGKAGLAALTTTMLIEASTQINSYDQILEKLYPLAADYSASLDKEMAIISGRVHRDNLEKYYELLIQAILQPAFKTEDFERIKTNTLNYLEKTLRYSNDEAFGKETLYQFIFNGTVYGHPEDGLIETVQSITLEDVKQFYRTHFTRENVVIGIGGGFDSGLVQRLKK